VSERYVSGATRVVQTDVGGEMVPEPVGTFHAVDVTHVEKYGKARAVCGANVQTVPDGHWPVSTPGYMVVCERCEGLTRG